MALSERWMAELEKLRAMGRYRVLAVPRGADFTSNDYLGYAKSSNEDDAGLPQLTLEWLPQLTLEGLLPQLTLEARWRTLEARWRTLEARWRTLEARWRTLEARWLSRSGTASRLLRGQHPIWEEVEGRLAEWHGSESALVMSSGYLANLGLLSAVIGPDDWVASDEYNHASIIDGLRLSRAERFIYRHLDLDHLEWGLRSARRRAGRECFIVSESLFSMEGDLAPLSELSALAERHGASLIVDEAHSTGCFGPSGAGLIAEAGLRERVLASVHTGGKALAVPGAYVCGSRLLREWLINRSRQLLFTTALPPAVGAWWREAIERVRYDDDGRRRLHANAAMFRQRLADAGVENVLGGHYIVPIVFGEDQRAVAAAAALQEAGFDVRAIRPPTVPAGAARLRVSIHADHPAELLGALAEAVREVSGEKREPRSEPREMGLAPRSTLAVRRSALCVLGTDTDAGKTGFSALWLAAFGNEYEYWKPLESGESDSARIRRLVPGAVVHEPVMSFAEAVAPLLAARRAGTTVPSAAELSARVPDGNGLLIETFGSPLSPLNEAELQAELIRRWGCPTVLVSWSSVGAVGRTLQCLSALDGLGIAPAAVVLFGPLDPFAAEQIERHRRIRVFSLEPPPSWTADGVAESASRQRAVLAEIRERVKIAATQT